MRGSIATLAGSSIDATFSLSLHGLDRLSAWLKEHSVTKVALLQGRSCWPWQAEKQRPRKFEGPVNLACWLDYEGPDVFARISSDAAWQPVMLSLRDQFALFVVKPAAAGGAYAIPSNRGAPRALATMLARGDFIAEYPKPALERLIDQLANCSPAVLQECLSFFEAESHGHWHNRARAKIARRLKHCDLPQVKRQQLVAAIERRLMEGRFTEQFKDQLRLMIHLDRDASLQTGILAKECPVPHVQRYGMWLVDRLS